MLQRDIFKRFSTAECRHRLAPIRQLSDAFWHFIIVMEYREFLADQIFLFHNVTQKKSPDPASLHIFYLFKQRKLKKVAEQIVALSH